MSGRNWIHLTIGWVATACALTVFLQLTYDVDQSFLRTLGGQLIRWTAFVPVSGALVLLREWLAKRDALSNLKKLVLQTGALLLAAGGHTVLLFALGLNVRPRNAMWALIVLLIFLAIDRWNRDRKRFAESEREAARLERNLHQARWAALEARIQPHFLFNTLHAIGMTCESDPSRAEQMIHALGALLRDSLTEDRPQLESLGEEMLRVDRYLDLIRLRYEEDVQITRNVPAELESIAIPPYSLQTLIENSLKHGVEVSTNPNSIRIEAQVSGPSKDELLLSVDDDGPGWPKTPHEGFGLRGLRQRLHSAFGETAELRLCDSELGGARVEIRIALREGRPTDG